MVPRERGEIGPERRAPAEAAARGRRSSPPRLRRGPRTGSRPSSVTARVAGLPASCSSAPSRSACPRVMPSASGRSSSAAIRGAAVAEHGLPGRARARAAARAPRACAPRRRGGGTGSARLPSARPAPATARATRPASSISSTPRSGAWLHDQPHQLVEGALGRHAPDAAASARPRGAASRRRPAGPARRRSAPSASCAAGRRRNDRSPTTRSRPRLEVRRAAVRVDQLAAGERPGHRVDREVAQREVGLDAPAAHRREVRLPAAVRRDHAPGAELAPTAGTRARRPPCAMPRASGSGSPAVAKSTSSTSSARPALQQVAHRAADQPGSAPRAPASRAIAHRRHRCGAARGRGHGSVTPVRRRERAAPSR